MAKKNAPSIVSIDRGQALRLKQLEQRVRELRNRCQDLLSEVIDKQVWREQLLAEERRAKDREPDRNLIRSLRSELTELKDLEDVLFRKLNETGAWSDKVRQREIAFVEAAERHELEIELAGLQARIAAMKPRPDDG